MPSKKPAGARSSRSPKTRTKPERTPRKTPKKKGFYVDLSPVKKLCSKSGFYANSADLSKLRVFFEVPGAFNISDEWDDKTEDYQLRAGTIMDMAKGQRLHVVFKCRNAMDPFYIERNQIPHMQALPTKVLAKVWNHGVFIADGSKTLRGHFKWSFEDKPEPFAFEPLRGNYWYPDQPYTRDSLVGWRGPAYLKSDLMSGELPNFYVPTSFYHDIRERILDRAEKWARRARAAGPGPV